MKTPECQLHCLPRIHQPVGTLELAWQFRYRLLRFTKRRLTYLWNRLYFTRTTTYPGKRSSYQLANKNEPLRPGDTVRVRSREDIRTTLDYWNQLKGCGFLEEMWPYCGTTQKVMKQVERFLDERDYLVKKCKGLVILENVTCPGTVDFGRCDRSCFFFWREEWLEKLESI